ncbi:peptidase inhibitor family I36 protein [Streptomyces sp. NPDC004111]|uniref:peptidase inhibitor family I36 protein n=1 Tax=Streptomyces sp. NPDC004111 TaxID=3364690 RepID=UPI0036A8189E
MKRKAAAVATGIVLAGSLLATGTAPAAAETRAATDCPSGWFCVWSGQNYTGRMQKVEGPNDNLTGFPVFQNFKSWYNRGKSCDFKWFSLRNGQGDSNVVPRGVKKTDNASHYIESNRWVNCR